MYKNEDIDNLEQWQDLNEDYDEINKDKDSSSESEILEPEILEPEILEPERDSSYVEPEDQDDELENMKDQFIRLQADFQNYKRRAEKDRINYMNMGLEKLAQDILPVVDNFERAIDSAENHDSFYDGIVLIERSLVEVLNKFEIKEIDCLNKPFDPNFEHAVLLSEEEGVESGLVTEVLQKGYTIDGKVLRPAMVKVSK
ncbi:co-chaperone GrpE [Peptoniphilus duerdenii ATCC BAA-1640]|uniref:Protein GrpE n=1 Tax=Peptoniphilus duerdenii ATCC BAA-1640 TaxID=862517 RepID=E0NIU2_9FIRM|nr:nucleotide exchange factor GrpE [Peptoniphilus duerdenii]EFM26310.1 co-chaperone GrpE [Peptoniphilus duerdenii ATCC BAA-1640]